MNNVIELQYNTKLTLDFNNECSKRSAIDDNKYIKLFDFN